MENTKEENILWCRGYERGFNKMKIEYDKVKEERDLLIEALENIMFLHISSDRHLTNLWNDKVNSAKELLNNLKNKNK